MDVGFLVHALNPKQLDRLHDRFNSFGLGGRASASEFRVPAEEYVPRADPNAWVSSPELLKTLPPEEGYMLSRSEKFPCILVRGRLERASFSTHRS